MLIQLGNHTPVQPLVRLLTNKSTHVRESAAEVLVRNATDRAIETLLQTMRRADDTRKIAFAYPLARLGVEEAENLYIQLLTDTAEIAGETYGQLEHIRSSRIASALVKRLSHPAPTERVAVAGTLLQLRGREHVETTQALVQALDDQALRPILVNRIWEPDAVPKLCHYFQHDHRPGMADLILKSLHRISQSYRIRVTRQELGLDT